MPRGTQLLLMRMPGGPVVTGADLRAVLVGPRIGSVAELGAVLVAGCPALLMLLDLILEVRVFSRPSRLRTAYAALAGLRYGRPRRWVTVALQQLFGMYCMLRRAAVPTAEAVSHPEGYGWLLL